MASYFAFSALFCCLWGAAVGKLVTISNVDYRRNVTGEIMDAHDGSYNQWEVGGPWYYYAMGYGSCKQGQDLCHGCGYGYSWIGVWKSSDMSNGSWTLVRDARDDTWPKCVYFRVHTVYNKKSMLYIMWANLNGGPADFAVGTSESPEGPFTYVHGINVGRKSGGDFDILVDDDGAAYIIYTATQLGHTMVVERLTDDYLNSAAGPHPAPTPSPPAGFHMVGLGACRDDDMKEPGFETNEPSHKAGVSQDACASACAAEKSCTAFAYCGGNPACLGACHMYMPAASSTVSKSWTWNTQGGGKLPVAKVTSEKWWGCFAKDVLTSVPVIASSLEASNVSSGVFGNEFVEAPILFKRKGIYYALFGNCCCFCGHGSGIGIYTANHPLGPYTYQNNVGCNANVTLTPGCGCGMNHNIAGGKTCSFYGQSLTKAQQNYLIRIPQSDGSMQYVWTGDRWQSATDGIKAHDLQYWSVLEFQKVGDIDLPLQFVWEDEIQISVPVSSTMDVTV